MKFHPLIGHHFTAKMSSEDCTMTIILLAKKISGVKMLWGLCLSCWTRQICWHVERTLALSLLVFTLY